MTSDNLAEFAKKLNNSQDYRVLTKYKKPSFYNQDDGGPKLIGVFLDIEATGLFYDQDKLIELGMVKFEYDSAGKIFRILKSSAFLAHIFLNFFTYCRRLRRNFGPNDKKW